MPRPVNVLNDKLRFYPERIAEYFAGGLAKPITAQLQITNRCMYKCSYCDKKNDTSEMLLDENLLTRLKHLGIQSLIFTGGEPLLRKDFAKLITECCEWFKVGLVTSLYKYDETLETKPVWIKVSLDTIDAAAYKRIKGLDAHSTVLENIERLWNNKSSNVTLGLQIVLCDENKDMEHIKQFYDQMSSICDYIQIRPIESMELNKYPDELLKKLEEFAANNPKVVISNKFYHTEIQRKCYARWTQIILDTNSDVMICCNRTSEKVANIYDEKLLEKIHHSDIDMRKCYRPCVMSGYNHYLKDLFTGKHKEFI